MPFLNFLFQPKNELESGGRSVAPVQSDASEPEKNCPNCHRDIPISTLWSNYNTCPCGYHFRMSARQRLHYLTDRESFTELFADVVTGDPLGFPNYAEKIETVRASSKEPEAVVCGTGRISGHPCALFLMEPYFMMGSMGAAVGEKITRTFEYALAHLSPARASALPGRASSSRRRKSRCPRASRRRRACSPTALWTASSPARSRRRPFRSCLRCTKEG